MRRACKGGFDGRDLGFQLVEASDGAASEHVGLADAILAAPVGATLLAGLVASVRGTSLTFVEPSQPTSTEVSAAVERVGEMSFADLVAAVLGAADLVGPWTLGAAEMLTLSYRWATDLGRVAEAITDRFGTQLDAPLDLDAQQWWSDDCDIELHVRPRFVDFDEVYGAGQFSWAGLWTVSDPPESIRTELARTWEMYGTPITRWVLPVRAEARVFEVHRPADWARLVVEFPKQAAAVDTWELDEYARTSRIAVGAHLVPDWAAVAGRYDGVHLSWAGFITTEGYISDLGTGANGNAVAMLRYWSSERTHWLADVFGKPGRLGS